MDLTGQPGCEFTVESANLANGPWQKWMNVTLPNTDQGRGVGVVGLNEPRRAAPQRFYRTAYPAY